MKKSIILTFLLAFAFTAVSLPASGQVSGQGKKEDTPAGFNQGKKAGWQSQYPPGWENKSEKEKKKWEKNLQKRKNKIVKTANKKGMSDLEAKNAADDFELLVRRGVDFRKAENVVKDNIKKGKKGQELSDSVEEGSGNILRNNEIKDNKIKEKVKAKGKNK